MSEFPVGINTPPDRNTDCQIHNSNPSGDPSRDMKIKQAIKLHVQSSINLVIFHMLLGKEAFLPFY